jgi:hypothetical protein
MIAGGLIHDIGEVDEDIPEPEKRKDRRRFELKEAKQGLEIITDPATILDKNQTDLMSLIYLYLGTSLERNDLVELLKNLYLRMGLIGII